MRICEDCEDKFRVKPDAGLDDLCNKCYEEASVGIPAMIPARGFNPPNN